MELIKTCPFCGRTHTLTNVNEDAYFDWMCGELIQDAFPTMSPTEREFLITGMCPECQAKVFGSDEDPEDDEDLVAEEFDLGEDGELWEEEFDDCDFEVGFDPYMGCFTGDC